MKIFTTSNTIRLAAPFVALALMGQSCALPFFSSGPKSSTDGGIFRSDDHGQSWKQKNTIAVSGKTAGSLRNVSIRSIVFDPQVEGRMFVGTVGSGIFISTNAGESWATTSLRSGDYQSIVFQPTDHEVMYTAAGSNILKSIDAGSTWKSVYSEAQPGVVMNWVAVSPAEPLTVWAVATGKILRSTDGGKNWSLIMAVPNFLPRSVTFSPDGKIMTVFTRTSGIYIIDPASGKWQDISKPLKKMTGAIDIKSVSVVPGATPIWVMATKYGLLRSVDGGSTWQVITTLNSGAVTIQNVVVNPNNTNEIFITVGNHIQRTADGGATWTVNSISTSRTPIMLSMDPFRVDRMFVGTFAAK